MKIRAYQLHDHAVILRPTPPTRDWDKINGFPLANLLLPGANVQGWDLLCPFSFEATWNGGSQAEDIEIRWPGTNSDWPTFVQSQLGGGLLTFFPGYQFKTEAAYALWLRGPINSSKDSLSPLESVVDASQLPCTVNIHWQFTRSHQTIHFVAGEPFATLLLYPKIGLETVNIEMRQQEEDAEAYEQTFQQIVDSPAVRDLFPRLRAAPTNSKQPGPPPAHKPELTNQPRSSPTLDARVTRPTDSLPANCFDTIDGHLDLQQFDSAFFVRERFFGRPRENFLRRYGEVYRREFYVIDSLKLVYLSIPKVACTTIKLALAKAVGIRFESHQDVEYVVHFHPEWRREGGHLRETQRGYFRFSFVRNPFDRLVSCYRGKIIFTQTAKIRTPLYHDYYFALPVNISFADFATRVSKIPDALADNHFKSQHALLYSGQELQVDYLGKFEQLEHDWQPIADKYQLDPLLNSTNVSKNKPGCHSDYRLYYTEPLARLVYERYSKDVHAFGYEEEYEELLAFVRRHQPDGLPTVAAWGVQGEEVA